MAVFDPLNEPDFVGRAVSGDSEAFRRLFDLLAAPLASFIERMGVPATDAEEIAADALAKVQKSLPRFRVDRGAKLTTWVFEIARNCAVDYRRAAARQSAQDEQFRLEYSRGDGFQSSELINRSREDAKVLAVALEALSPGDRDILRMRQVMEYAEIARAENATEQAVRVRHKRAVDRLKEEIAHRGNHG